MRTKPHILRWLSIAVGMLFLTVAFAVGTANAQSQAAAKAPAAAPAQPQNQPQYKELRVADPKLKEWSDLATKKSDERIQNISNMLSGAAPLDQKALQSFFYTIVFPQFTRLDNIYAKKGVRGAPNLKATYCMLPDMRADFSRMFLQDATNAQAHEALVDLTLTAMNHIASDNYHPIARYNAMLLIAQLNQNEANETPHPKALEILKDAARNEKTIDAVRAAAMIGLVRHAKAGTTDANSAGRLAGLLVQLVNDNKRPSDRSQAGHDWMRRRALEALVAMYGQNPPANGYFVQLFDTLLADTSSTLEFRAEVVEAFLTSKFVAPKNFDSAKFAAGIGQVAVDAYHIELETTVQMGRKVYADGMTYYFNLVDKALAALDKAAPSPNIAKLQTALTELKDSTVLEELAFDAQPDPARELKLYDQIAKAGAELESVVTGKPVSDLLPKRGKVGGNSQAGMVGGGYGGGGYGGGRPGGGYGRPGGGYGAPSRGTGADRPGGGYGAPPRGNFGGAR